MKVRPFVFVIAAVIALAVIAWAEINAQWWREQPLFEDAPRIISAIQAYTQDLQAQQEPVPPAISLRELVDARYLSADDARGFDDMEVTISLARDEVHAKQVLMRVRMRDGSETALMADGSIQALPK